MCISTNGWTDRSLSRRLRRFSLSLVVALACGVACRPAQTQAPGPPAVQPIRVNVRRVLVGVTLTDEHGKFVTGLKREEFHVFDNNVEQPITEFSSVDAPAQILLLVEAGPAVYFLQDAHILASDAMLGGLLPGDRVAIARYDISPTPILAYTTDKGAAQSALAAIRFNLGFGQLNLSSSLNTVLDWLGQVPGKKTIVLLSTGIDTSPLAAIESVQTRLQSGEVRVLCVSVTGPMRNGKKGSAKQLEENEAAFADGDARLRSIADATGGRAFFPENAKAIEQIYAQVAQIVRNEYSLAFAPPTADGLVHSITVKVDLPALAGNAKTAGYRIDHRKAYAAPGS